MRQYARLSCYTCAAGAFDLVVHSDTLEHVPDPLRGLSECRRVLRPNGGLCFTVPVIVGRLTRSRTVLPKSFHGMETTLSDDWAVQTEFGGDARAQDVTRSPGGVSRMWGDGEAGRRYDLPIGGCA